MSEWVRLSGIERMSTDRNHDGVTIKLFISACNVPEAARGVFDKDKHVFRIEFLYLSNEEEKEVTVRGHEGVSLFVGRKSQRLLAIEVDVKGQDVSAFNFKLAVQASAERAIKQLGQQLPQARRHGNYKIARQAIEQNLSKLLALGAEA